jgi:hypothetical protein
MDHKQETKARENKTKILCKRLCEGESLNTVLEDDNWDMLKNYGQWEANIERYQRAQQRNKPDCIDWIPNTWDLSLLYDKPGQNKKRHYWFWSTVPDKGKTKFLELVDQEHRASWYNKSEVYQTIHKDSQFILIDEYTTPTIHATTLNQMCDGNYLYPSKGGHAIKIKACILICGNKRPQDLYPNAFKYIEARFNIICLDNETKQVKWPAILRVLDGATKEDNSKEKESEVAASHDSV